MLTCSGASMYNLCDDEEDEDGVTMGKEKVEENDKTKEKMKIIRSKMENLTIGKKVATHKVRNPPLFTNIFNLHVISYHFLQL